MQVRLSKPQQVIQEMSGGLRESWKKHLIEMFLEKYTVVKLWCEGFIEKNSNFSFAAL